jgi:sugar/nucleoside kinase (ribokinase family)
MDLGGPPRLFTVGSIVADIRLEAPHLPVRGGDVIASSARISAGGGFNILCAAARQGLRCVFAGRHGAGPYGERIRAELLREGVSVVHERAPEGDSGFCIVLVEPDGERTFVTSPGVEAHLAGRRLPDVPVAPGDTVFASGYDLAYPELGPAIAGWMAEAPRSVRFVVDPGPLAADIPGNVMALVMPRVSVWAMNRREAELIAGTTEPDAVRARMRPGLAQDAALVLRDGPRGAWISTGAGEAARRIPAPAVAAVDTTGAGDAHSGAMIAALAAGLELDEAVRRANAAAALSVTRAGPAASPTLSELDSFLASEDRRRGGAAACGERSETDFSREEA